MATKKSDSESKAEVRGHETFMEERRKRREEATTVDGSETFPPLEGEDRDVNREAPRVEA